MNFSEYKTMADRIKALQDKWLIGTTCRRHKNGVFWVSDCGRFVIMKHAGHSEYLHRGGPTDHCPTYYCMYDLESKGEIDYKGDPCLKRWEGRWLKKYDEEVEALVGN